MAAMRPAVLLATLVRLATSRGAGSLRGVSGSSQVLGPRLWDVIGPFPASSREQGADVLEAFGGILQIPRGGNQTYPSELVPKWSGHDAGRARWMQVQSMAESGAVGINYGDLRWDLLDDALGPTVLRSRGWAIGDFFLSADGFYIATCTGISWFLVDGARVNGDPYRTGWRGGQSMHLKAGNHTLHVPFGAYASHKEFTCKLDPCSQEPDSFPLHVISRGGIGGRPFLFPDVVEGRLASELASLVLENRGQQTLQVFHAEVGENSFGLGASLRRPMLLSPGQQLPVDLRLSQEAQHSLECGLYKWGLWLQRLNFSVRARDEATDAEVSASIVLDITCKNFSDPYAFTFLDADESVQYATVRSPKGPCPEEGCAVLFATHGASVESHPIRNRAWADSYHRQDRAWVLLPTNRDKYGYDWQGPGFRDGFMALRHLSDELPGVPDGQRQEMRANPQRLLLSGHSMGGHGCLEYLTHHGDPVLAAAPASGWISFKLYAFDRFRTGDGLIDPILRGIMYSAIAEWDTDLYVENAVGIPTVVRVGGNDTTVPPWELRRFARLLDQESGDPDAVTVSEVPGVGHWWGGVVDDQELQEFYDKALAGPLPLLPQHFTVVTLNPATSTGRGGIRIDQLQIPFRLARVHVERSQEDGIWNLRTENVRRFSFHEITGRPLPAAGVIVDGMAFDGDVLPSWPDHLCATSDAAPPAWHVCRGIAWHASERSAASYGPMRQVFESQLAIVYGTQAADASYNSLLRERALFVANAAYYRGRFGIELLADTDAAAQRILAGEDRRNTIILGGPEVNSFAAAALPGKETWPIWWETSEEANGSYAYRVGPHRYTSPGLGYLFLAPLRYSAKKEAVSDSAPRLALVVTAGGREGFELASTLLPLSSGLTLPDYMVVEQSFRWKGAGGVVAAGFYDNHWRVSSLSGYMRPYLKSH
eukprot:TRINITY_DN28299_c0_g1_i1.p1 TRINITY_DN28299_c0_g1~~TRINITY_DN28299_c0_g1_i1.p1  ORF type:complete len:947 (-),score=155.49 TRINITY_DN28299_c0_g1_i1:5-2812(-)